jgi:murein DD-endopeptidase MepM/ murein hydrolase activator NlpD
MHKYSLNSNDNYFSFMIVPPNGKGTYTWRLPKWLLITILLVFSILIIFISATLYYIFSNSLDRSKFEQLQQTTKEQAKEITQFTEQLSALKEQIQDLIDKEEDIRAFLGESRIKYKRKTSRRKKSKKRVQTFKKNYQMLAKKKAPQLTLNYLEKQINNTAEAINFYYQKVQRNKERFASTPSIWPIYGRIRSGFGWRRHPITGRKVFHKGIDIPSWIGAPIKAAADGVIKYAGWSGTYGYVVIIDHDFGYRTIYAHASQLLVKKREAVKKGQIIAQVGTSGLSTGSHLHYEVHHWRKVIPPTDYLDLDVFTASTRIW